MILIHAGGIGKPRHVKPMPAPCLAVARRGEQAIHHLLVSRWRRVSQKCLEFGGRWRQTSQIIGKTPQQGGLRRLRRGLQLLFLEFRQDEPVDSSPHPLLIAHLWQRGILYRTECPEFPILICNLTPAGEDGSRPFLFWPGRAHFDPLPQRRDVGIAQLPRRRHPDRVGICDRAIQPASGRVARHHHTGFLKRCLRREA